MQTELDKLAHQIIVARSPVFQHRSRTHIKPITAKTLEELQRQFHGHIANINLRNDLAEATKRTKNEYEYDRLHGALHVLNKIPLAVGIETRRNRMNELRRFTQDNLNAPKPEMYAKAEAEMSSAVAEDEGGNQPQRTPVTLAPNSNTNRWDETRGKTKAPRAPRAKPLDCEGPGQGPGPTPAPKRRGRPPKNAR